MSFGHAKAAARAVSIGSKVRLLQGLDTAGRSSYCSKFAEVGFLLRNRSD